VSLAVAPSAFRSFVFDDDGVMSRAGYFVDGRMERFSRAVGSIRWTFLEAVTFEDGNVGVRGVDSSEGLSLIAIIGLMAMVHTSFTNQFVLGKELGDR
jgi:hypothetical protein